MTFGAGLRSILCQDRDIIKVREIRNLETSQIAVRTSLTGHLMLSMLQTNSTLKSMSRLVDMEIQSYLLTSSIVGGVSRRLIRRICRDCVQVVEATTEEKLFLQTYNHHISHLKKGVGCPACNHSGYRGCIAVHEMLPLLPELKEEILRDVSANKVN